ncbi:MAG: hypothetical protein SPJ06_03510 [Bacilli bacterium]|nr:hypothetical protein [Bacilli bacterium]
MEKMKLTMESLSGSILLSSDFDGNLYRLSDGSILKLFNAVYLDSYKRQNIDLKEKMLQVETIHHPRIIVPDRMCCMDDDVVGYIRRDVSGRSFTEFFSNESDNDKVNLYRYALIHHNLESVVEECSDIVFPCLCDETGIYLEQDFKPYFVNFEELQHGTFRAGRVSKKLGLRTDSNDSRYLSDGLFTKNLDKMSSIYLYFLNTFNVDLSKFDSTSVGEVFNGLGLKDDDICHKVWSLFDKDYDNYFLGDDVFRIAEEYDMRVVFNTRKTCVKRLVKK